MAKNTLLTQVKRHCTSQASNSQATLALTLATIDHFRGDSGDWTPLAFLINGSQPAQSRIIRKITGSIVQGWRVAKDAKQDSGLRFSKIQDSNQGFDGTVLEVLRTLVDEKQTTGGAAVKAAFFPKTEEKSAEEKLEARIKSTLAFLKGIGVEKSVFTNRLLNT